MVSELNSFCKVHRAYFNDGEDALAGEAPGLDVVDAGVLSDVEVRDGRLFSGFEVSDSL